MSTDPLPAVHCRPTVSDLLSRSLSTSVRQLHADILILLTVCITAASDISVCTDDIAVWMSINWLTGGRPEDLGLCCIQRRLRSSGLPSVAVSTNCLSHHFKLALVRDLGIYLDMDVSMRSHVAKTVSACALWCYVSFGVSVGHFPDLFFFRSLS